MGALMEPPFLADWLGESPGMAALRDRAARLLQRQSDRGRPPPGGGAPPTGRLPPVLIQGETGVGKGLVARSLHRAGPRASGPFVDVNCAAIPEHLLESELFGYERGAFTDARHAKAGLFQAANHGTIFLDEIGLLPEALQAKLLKALEDRAVRRLGSTRSEPVDVWILAATNENLSGAAQTRPFRQDLYHRLAVMVLTIPPLRERGEDVLRLAAHFLDRACAEYRMPARSFSPEARAALLAYPWPGNVRELANVMERVALLTEVPVVTVEHLGLPAVPAASAAADTGPAAETDEGSALADTLGTVERAHLVEALRQTGGNVTRAAARLGISRDTLRYRMEKHGLTREGPERPPRQRTPGPRRLAPVQEPPPAPATPREPAAGTAAIETGASLAVRWEGRKLAFLRSALILPADVDPAFSPSRGMETLVEKIRTFGGRIEEMSPTGVIAAFGLEPVEDASQRAALAAMAVHKAAERASGEGVGIGVRSGIAARKVNVGTFPRRDPDRSGRQARDVGDARHPPPARGAGRDPGGGGRGELPRPPLRLRARGDRRAGRTRAAPGSGAARGPEIRPARRPVRGTRPGDRPPVEPTRGRPPGPRAGRGPARRGRPREIAPPPRVPRAAARRARAARDVPGRAMPVLRHRHPLLPDPRHSPVQLPARRGRQRGGGRREDPGRYPADGDRAGRGPPVRAAPLRHLGRHGGPRHAHDLGHQGDGPSRRCASSS